VNGCIWDSGLRVLPLNLVLSALLLRFALLLWFADLCAGTTMAF
jgi:hypothetical protein